MKPLIGITDGMGLSHYAAQMPLSLHQLNDSYVQAVIQAGGIPVILPVCREEETMRAMVDRVDGVILSGGGDLDPAHFGQRATGKLGEVSPRRDQAELTVAMYVLKHTEKPLLGICRGIQVLNVALGGTLHIDLPTAGKLEHSLTMYPRDEVSHGITVAEDSRLGEIFGPGGHRVNSFHHQAVDVPGAGLRATAWSEPDGVIEAVELSGQRFALGVQWHPEELRAGEDAQRLFHAFVAAAGDCP